MNQRVLRGMGWLPDVPSVRDYTTSHPEVRPLLAKTRLTESLAAPPALPSKVDLRGHFPPVVDQQNLGACTANAAAALIGYFEKKALGRSINASRLFIYKATRNLTGTIGDARVSADHHGSARRFRRAARGLLAVRRQRGKLQQAF